jgi:peptidoglycan/xylan/chitin deacetylase (PgdA/CDA1 family)
MRAVGTITHVITDARAVAITFDDGPDPRTTPRVLEVLEDFGARATFFMVGESAARAPALVREVAAAGHAIGNHSWSHPPFPAISGRERRRQLRDCATALAPHGLKLFRPPYGKQNLASRLDALALGYRVVTWNVNPRDYQEADRGVLATKLLGGIRPGSIVLLHDRVFQSEGSSPPNAPPQVGPIHENREEMLAALRQVLGRLAAEFRFVTVPELLHLGRPVRVRW